MRYRSLSKQYTRCAMFVHPSPLSRALASARLQAVWSGLQIVRNIRRRMGSRTSASARQQRKLPHPDLGRRAERRLPLGAEVAWAALDLELRVLGEGLPH